MKNDYIVLYASIRVVIIVYPSFWLEHQMLN